jgi:hypothetical protein
MLNLVLGFLAGVAAAILFFKGQAQIWYVWVLFFLGAGSIVFSFDVLKGSIKEHENRAAILGPLMFGIPGILLVGASFFWGM